MLEVWNRFGIAVIELLDCSKTKHNQRKGPHTSRSGDSFLANMYVAAQEDANELLSGVHITHSCRWVLC